MKPMSTFSLWWSLFWRFTLLLIACSFVLGPLAALLTSGFDVGTGIRVHPTVGWWLFAAILWAISFASMPVFIFVIWGRRIELQLWQWVTIARAVGTFFFVLGVINVGVWKSASLDTWINFKVWAPLPLFAGFLAVLCAWIRKSRAAA
jgi:intracellular septation protein A